MISPLQDSQVLTGKRKVFTPPTVEEALAASADWKALADLWSLLHVYLEPVKGGGSGVRTAPGSKPPFSVAASDLIREISEWAGYFALELMDETSDYAASVDVEQRLRDIASRYGHWTNLPNRRSRDFCDMAKRLMGKARVLIERPPPPDWLGPCPVTFGCQGQLYLRVGRAAATCDQCESVVDMGTWRENLRRALESRLMRRGEIAPALRMLGGKVASSTVRSWIHRGRLVPIIKTPEMFRLTDAMDLAKIKAGR